MSPSPATDAVIPPIEPATSPAKRLNLIVSESAYREAISLSKETRRSVSELLRFGLALVRIAVQENRIGNRLVVTKGTGEPVKEIVVPF